MDRAEERILLLALRGRDTEVIEQLLCRQGYLCQSVSSAAELAHALALGAGAAVITEESLADAGVSKLTAWLDSQPSWSDFPFILLATKRSGRRPLEAFRLLEALGAVVVLERPINSETLARAVNSALRGRRRQYQARQHLLALEAAEEGLTQLNTTLESRISQRTAELSLANNQLMQEVAERERAQAALAQSQKMEAVGQLTGGIAHDFNNLLTVIVGNLDLIRRRAPDERTSRLADYAREAANRAAKLTHQLLAFSRTQRLTLQPVDINALILGMGDLLKRTIGPQIVIDMQLDDGQPWAMADANQLELAILNLAINARDAMPGGGALQIASSRRHDPDGAAPDPAFAVLTVTDTGTGVPKHLLSKVFDPFFTTKALGKGTGLGLSQVYGIAQQSGGRVQLDSVEGEGATVEVWLPLAPPAAAVAHASAAPDPRRGNGRERILVVDDDPGVRRFVVDCLQSAGYSVFEAKGGFEGLQQLGAAAPALLIVDYAMPGMTGVEMAQQVRDRQPDLPIILATGYADMEAVQKVIAPEYVLRKPFRVDDLEAAVRHALTSTAAYTH